MTIAELIERLQDLNPDAKVRIAYQPSYPLWGVAAGVAPGGDDGQAFANGECPECGYTEQHSEDCTSTDIDLSAGLGEAEFVYITTRDSQNGYASRALWEVANA